MNKKSYHTWLADAEVRLRTKLHLTPESIFDTALVLGTGWGDSLASDSTKFLNLTDLPLGDSLEVIEGHKRRIELGNVGGRQVLILRGRVHMNECTFNPDAAMFVRMQIELMLRLGVKNLILTCGAGGLGKDATPGTIVHINSFVSDWNEVMPLFPGEFCSPEEVLGHDLTLNFNGEMTHKLLSGPYVFWRGPHIEGIKHDKKHMRERGGVAVGMSIKPECAVAALHKDVNVHAFAHIMNGDAEVLDHIVHTEKAQANSDTLGAFLTNVVSNLSP